MTEEPAFVVELRQLAEKAFAKADHWEAAGNAVWAQDWRRTGQRHLGRVADWFGIEPGRDPVAPVRKTEAEKAAVRAWKAEAAEALLSARQVEFYERSMTFPPSVNVFHDDYAQVIAAAGADRLIVTPRGSLYVLQEVCSETGWRARRFFDGAGPARAYLIAVAVGLDPVLTAAAASLPDNPKDALRL